MSVRRTATATLAGSAVGSSAPPRPDGRAELRLGLRAVMVLAALAVPVTAVAAAIQGARGALGAIAGMTLVAVLFGGGGLVQAMAARRGVAQMGSTVMVGLGARLLTYLIALVALAQVDVLHRPSLAVATLLGVIAATAYEMRVMARTPQLFWVETGRGRTAPQGAAGR
jgi:hypothetical protein